MKFKKPVVVIFGAGATKGGMEGEGKSFPLPPTDIDFFHVSNQLRVWEKGTVYFARNVLRSVRNLYDKTSGVGLEYYYRDIETRQEIVTFAPPRHNPKNWSIPIADLKELIRRVFIHTTCLLDDNMRYCLIKSKIHSEILDRLEKGDAIVTFNYDLLIEQSFSSNFNWHPSDGYGIKIEIGTEASNIWKDREKKESKCLLLKLHGSINWAKKKDKITLKDRPYRVKGRERANVAICPPSWRKPVDEEPYKLLWKQARNHLERAKTLIILGYSLPETDFLAQSFLKEIVETKRKPDKYEKVCRLEQLRLVDLDSEVRKKFIQLLNPAMDYKTHIFEYSSLKQFYESLSKPEAMPKPTPLAKK